MHESFILAFFGIVVGLPVIGSMVEKMHKRHMAFKERQLDTISNETAEKSAQYAAHTERLEQRMRVIERIVTDKGIDVASEIERLRDRPN